MMGAPVIAQAVRAELGAAEDLARSAERHFDHGRPGAALHDLVCASLIEGRLGTLAGFDPNDTTGMARLALAGRLDTLTVCLCQRLDRPPTPAPGDTTP